MELIDIISPSPQIMHNNTLINPFSIGISDAVDFIPLYAVTTSLEVTEFSSGLILYYRPPLIPFIQKLDYISLVNDFQYPGSRSQITSYRYKIDNEVNTIKVWRGIISSESNDILLLFTIKSGTKLEHTRWKFRTDNLRLYVAIEFMSNPIYRNVYKRIFNQIILTCMNSGVEVVYINSKEIGDRTYRNHFNVEFNSLTELNEILSTEVDEIIAFQEPQLFDIPVDSLSDIDEQPQPVQARARRSRGSIVSESIVSEGSVMNASPYEQAVDMIQSAVQGSYSEFAIQSNIYAQSLSAEETIISTSPSSEAIISSMNQRLDELNASSVVESFNNEISQSDEDTDFEEQSDTETSEQEEVSPF